MINLLPDLSLIFVVRIKHGYSCRCFLSVFFSPLFVACGETIPLHHLVYFLHVETR